MSVWRLAGSSFSTIQSWVFDGLDTVSGKAASKRGRLLRFSALSGHHFLTCDVTFRIFFPCFARRFLRFNYGDSV